MLPNMPSARSCSSHAADLASADVRAMQYVRTTAAVIKPSAAAHAARSFGRLRCVWSHRVVADNAAPDRDLSRQSLGECSDVQCYHAHWSVCSQVMDACKVSDALCAHGNCNWEGGVAWNIPMCPLDLSANKWPVHQSGTWTVGPTEPTLANRQHRALVTHGSKTCRVRRGRSVSHTAPSLL